MESTLFTNRWYALKPSRLVTQKPTEVNVLGHNLVLWRNHEKQIVVQNNYCPHRGAKLSMGKLLHKKKCIECPYHGWQFDYNGLLKDVPAEESKLVEKLQLDTYDSMESGGLVWFCPGSPSGYNPPVIKEMHDRNWTSVTGQAVFENDWITTLENSTDITHVNFVHSDFGNPENGRVSEVDIAQKSPDFIRMYSTINHKSDNAILSFTDNPAVRVKHSLLLPNTVSIQFFVKDFLNVITYVTYTPITEKKTLMNWVFLRTPKIPILDKILDRSFVRGMEKAISEDQDIVRSLKMPSTRINIDADQVQIMFRKQLHKLKLLEPSTEY